MPRRPVPSAAPRLPELARRANPRRAGDAAPSLRPTRGQGAAPDLFPHAAAVFMDFKIQLQARVRRQPRGRHKSGRRAKPDLRNAADGTPRAHGFHLRHPLRVAHLSRQQNLSRQHMQINKGGLLPGQRTYEFRHVLRRVEHEHARRLAIQPETVGQPLPPGTGGQLQVGRRCGPRNRQCHAIGDEPASRRIRPQGLHGLGARAGNAPAVKANVAASARRHISATEPKRDAARAPPREHDVAKNGDRSNLTAAPIREQAVGRCHVMPCREPIHGQRGPAPRDSAVSSS